MIVWRTIRSLLKIELKFVWIVDWRKIWTKSFKLILKLKSAIFVPTIKHDNPNRFIFSTLSSIMLLIQYRCRITDEIWQIKICCCWKFEKNTYHPNVDSHVEWNSCFFHILDHFIHFNELLLMLPSRFSCLSLNFSIPRSSSSEISFITKSWLRVFRQFEINFGVKINEYNP